MMGGKLYNIGYPVNHKLLIAVKWIKTPIAPPIIRSQCTCSRVGMGSRNKDIGGRDTHPLRDQPFGRVNQVLIQTQKICHDKSQLSGAIVKHQTTRMQLIMHFNGRRLMPLTNQFTSKKRSDIRRCRTGLENLLFMLFRSYVDRHSCRVHLSG